MYALYRDHSHYRNSRNRPLVVLKDGTLAHWLRKHGDVWVKLDDTSTVEGWVADDVVRRMRDDGMAFYEVVYDVDGTLDSVTKHDPFSALCHRYLTENRTNRSAELNAYSQYDEPIVINLECTVFADSEQMAIDIARLRIVQLLHARAAQFEGSN